MKDWDKISTDFAITPDTNWYMHRGLYLHNVNKIANNVYLTHLKKYNMEWGIPVMPEARRNDSTLFGDAYNNFNAGNLDIMLEGIGGFSYSVVNNTSLMLTHYHRNGLSWNFTSLLEAKILTRPNGFTLLLLETRMETVFIKSM